MWHPEREKPFEKDDLMLLKIILKSKMKSIILAAGKGSRLGN